MREVFESRFYRFSYVTWQLRSLIISTISNTSASELEVRSHFLLLQEEARRRIKGKLICVSCSPTSPSMRDPLPRWAEHALWLQAAVTLHSTFLFQLCPCFGHWFSQLQNPASAPLDLNPALSPVVFASQISPVGSAFDYQTLPSEEVLCTPVLTIGARGRAGREQRRQVLPWTVSSKGRTFSDLVTYMKNGKVGASFLPCPSGWKDKAVLSTWSPVLLWPASFSDRETQTFPPSCTCSQKGKERVRGHSGCCGYRTEPWCLPLPPGRVQL